PGFNSRLWMATDKIFIGIVCLGALGLTTDRFFRYLIVRFAINMGRSNSRSARTSWRNAAERCDPANRGSRQIPDEKKHYRAHLLERARHGNAELISPGFETRYDGGVQFDPASE